MLNLVFIVPNLFSKQDICLFLTDIISHHGLAVPDIEHAVADDRVCEMFERPGGNVKGT